jgi:hypothetical protein
VKDGFPKRALFFCQVFLRVLVMSRDVFRVAQTDKLITRVCFFCIRITCREVFTARREKDVLYLVGGDVLLISVAERLC